MENGNQSYEVGKGKPPVEHRFKPGNPGGPGRQRKTAAYRELEKMTRTQVQDALERLLSASVDRALRILQKGGDAEAARIFLSLVDRSVGPVPSASYVAANISGGGNEAKIVTADEIRATVLGYAARLAAREIDGADHRD